MKRTHILAFCSVLFVSVEALTISSHQNVLDLKNCKKPPPSLASSLHVSKRSTLGNGGGLGGGSVVGSNLKVAACIHF
jgi:hypothetical protein